jgi:hypothetical protein
MSTQYILCEEDVGTHEDILHPPPYETREEAEKELKRLDHNPNCEIVFYIKQFKEFDTLTMDEGAC